MSKPSLLFITRVWPDFTGTGTAMRCGIMVEALAAYYKVFLLVIPILGTPLIRKPSREMLGLCESVAEYSVEGREDTAYRRVNDASAPQARLAAAAGSSKTWLGRFVTAETVRGANSLYAGVRFDAVHVFRLDMAPFATPHLEADPRRRPLRVLDLDEVESRTRRRLAALYELNGETALAAFERVEADKYDRLEREYLPRFDEVWVASHTDREEASALCGAARVLVVPNAVRLPECPPATKTAGTFTLFFVGAMAYYPNRDGVAYLCSQVVPRLRELAGRPFQVFVAGRDSDLVRDLAREPEVTVAGPVPDLAPYYAATDAVIVPLRAGGGSRIKILEAFSYQRPVVSTAVGAEGLNLRHESEILLADSPEDLARCCAWVMEQPMRARAMAGRAYQWVRANHSLETVQAVLRRRGGFE